MIAHEPTTNRLENECEFYESVSSTCRKWWCDRRTEDRIFITSFATPMPISALSTQRYDLIVRLFQESQPLEMTDQANDNFVRWNPRTGWRLRWRHPVRKSTTPFSTCESRLWPLRLRLQAQSEVSISWAYSKPLRWSALLIILMAYRARFVIALPRFFQSLSLSPLFAFVIDVKNARMRA